MKDRQLLLQLRSTSINQFARLSQKVAFELLEEAKKGICPDGATVGWRAQDAPHGYDEVEFLALKIVLNDGTTVYTSYNGGIIETDDTIELPANAFPSAVELLEGTQVIVTALPFVADAVTITVDPVSTRDWELMEVYAGHLENGTLLNQVSIVYPGQLLTVSVGEDKTDFARVRVSDDSINGCKRLVANTEITVVPKTRARPSSPSPPLQLAGTSHDWTDSMKVVAKQEGLPLLELEPGTVMIHPDTMTSHFPKWSDSGCQHAIVWKDLINESHNDKQEDHFNGGTVVQIKVSDSVGKDQVALYILNRYSIAATPLFDSVRVQPLSLKSINRIRERTEEYLLQNELMISVEILNSVENDRTPGKVWRLTDNADCGLSFVHSSPGLLPSTDDNEAYFVDGSIFILPDSVAGVPLGKLTLTKPKPNHQNSKVDYFQIPSFIVGTRDLKICRDIQSSTLPLPSSDKFLNSLQPTTPYRRMTDSSWTSDLLENKDAFDAWIFHGDIGTGKTHCAQIFATLTRMKWQSPTFYLDCKKLQSSNDLRMNSTLQELTQVFREALAVHPSVLILDDLDQLAINMSSDEGTGGGGSSNQQQVNPTAVDQSKLVANHIQALMELCRMKVIFVITCNSTKDLAPEVLEAAPCHNVIEIEGLDPIERNGLLHAMLALDWKVSLDNVASLSEGYRPHDLKLVATRVKHQSTKESELNQTLTSVMSEYIPLARQGVVSETSKTVHDWNDDLGGMFEAKEKLKSTILDPIKYRRIYEKAPIKLPKGILLFGPPGCGKTYLVPALARECGHTLITCRGPELLDRYIGASEANVRRLFERAKSAAPSILFLDEFDALAPRRGSDHTGVTDRVVNQLLTYLDGVETTLEGVFIIAATSRPDKIDPALLRPGRLEQHVFVSFPHSSEELNHLMTKMMSKRKMIDVHLVNSIGSGMFPLSRDEADRLVQFSAADIKAVLDTAQLEAINQHLDAPASFRPPSVLTIHEHHFRQALLATRPSVSVQDRAMLDHIYQPFLGTTTRDTYAKKAGPSSKEIKTSLR